MTPTNAQTLITARSVVAVAEGAVSCDLSGEAVILHLTTGVYFGLDPVGAEVWHLIQQPHSVDQICAGLMSKYDVDRDRCQASVIRLLERMAEHGLVQISHDAAAS